MKSKIKESDIVYQIVQYLTLKRYLFQRNNTGAFTNKAGHFFRFGSRGWPDFLVFKGNKFYGIEAKRLEKSSKQSPEQVEFQKRFEKEGGIYILARGLEDVRRTGL